MNVILDLKTHCNYHKNEMRQYLVAGDQSPVKGQVRNHSMIPVKGIREAYWSSRGMKVMPERIREVFLRKCVLTGIIKEH